MNAELSDTACTMNPTLLSSEDIHVNLAQLGCNWRIDEQGRLHKTFECVDFFDAFAIASCAAMIAEEEQHHPEVFVKWGSCSITLWTHSVKGLSMNDFIVAAEIEKAAD